MFVVTRGASLEKYRQLLNILSLGGASLEEYSPRYKVCCQ